MLFLARSIITKNFSEAGACRPRSKRGSSWYIVDLTGRFNLARFTMTLGESAEAFMRLCRSLSILEEDAVRVVQWFQGRTLREGMAGSPPLKLTDLLTVPGLSAKICFKLAPYADVYPISARYNVNTFAPAGVGGADSRVYTRARRAASPTDLKPLYLKQHLGG